MGNRIATMEERNDRYRIADAARRLGGAALPAGIAKPGLAHDTHAIAILMHDDMAFRALEQWVVGGRAATANPSCSSQRIIQTCKQVQGSFLVNR